jgi:hypothetical protein
MHDAVNHYGKRLDGALTSLTQLLQDGEKLAEREAKNLETAETGDDFDDGDAATQAEVTAAVQRAVELLAEAEDAVRDARDAIKTVRP